MDKEGRYLWPGFGENVRVLKWIVDRVRGQADAVVESPIGHLPAPGTLDLSGLSVDGAAGEQLLQVERGEWVEESERHRKFLEQFGERTPAALWQEHAALRSRLGL